MKEKQLSVPEALNVAHERISRLTPQGPIAHRTEDSKAECLHQVVIGFEWAKAALSNVYCSNKPFKFEQLYASLDSAWWHEQ